MRVPRAITIALTAMVSSSCALASMSRAPTVPGAREFSRSIQVRGKPFELHLMAPRTPGAHPVMVLYASGDGGWFGAAVDMFHQIGNAGYFAVGFSSRAFLRIERPHGSLVTAAQLSAEYDQILSPARVALGLGPTTRVVLTGWSRGAAFSVLVGSERLSQDDILGVIAIGLAEGEDLAINDAADDTDNSSGSRQRQWPFETYALISRLDALPCAVIQASHDVYLPAARARQLFGPDTPLRRLYAIEASNHRFSGGKAAFDMALLDALHWIAASARVAADPMPATTPIGESSMRATRVSANGAWGRVRPASSTDVPVAVDAPLLRCCERH